MGQELSLKQVNTMFPKSPGVTVFKSWFNALIKAAAVDPAALWGNDDVREIPLGGAQYVITLTKPNMDKIKRTLNSGRRPTFKESKWIITYETLTGGKGPIAILEFGEPGRLVLKIKLETTGKKPRGTGKASKKPDTDEQEKVTLKIFEELLSVATPKWDRLGYKALRDEKLKRLYGDIDHPEREDWDKHFELQFNEIRAKTKLPNSKFNVYDYDGFLKFIDNWVTKKGPHGSGKAWPIAGKISQKDSWNPADIWLVKSGNEYDDYVDRIQTAGTLEEINVVLRHAYAKMIIVGISLKKSSGKPGDLHYDLINLESKLPQYPKIIFETMKIDLPFNEKTKEFSKTTNNLKVKLKGGTTVGEMRIGTNTTGKGNNTYEFKAAGAQSAQLGKIPKDLMLERLQGMSMFSGMTSLPTWQNVEDHMPTGIGDKKNISYWTNMVKTIKNKPDYFTIQDQTLNDFVGNMIAIGDKDIIEKTESAAGQIVEFAYILSQMSRPQVNEFVEDCFYYAQKVGMGSRYRFGPFGKLH